MKVRYPRSAIPRSTALTELVLSPSPVPERIDPALRRVLASRIGSLAPDRQLGSLRLDSYSVQQARSQSPRPSEPFSWSPRIARRILGLPAARRVLTGQASSPSTAVRAEIDSIIARCAERPPRPGSLGGWLTEAPFGVIGAVMGEAVTYSTELVTCLDWDSLGDAASVGLADPVWAAPGAPWVALRGRKDATITLGDGPGTRALLAVRSGRLERSSRDDLAHVALVEGLANPDLPVPTRVVGLWPASGKAVSIEMTRETVRHAARAVVEAMTTLRRNDSQLHAA